MTASKKQLSHEPANLNTCLGTGFISGVAPLTRHGQSPIFLQVARHWAFLLALAAMAFAGTAARAVSPEFTSIPTLNFSATVDGAAPLSQVITANSTGASIFFTAAASTNSGGRG